MLGLVGEKTYKGSGHLCNSEQGEKGLMYFLCCGKENPHCQTEDSAHYLQRLKRQGAKQKAKKKNFNQHT